MKLIKHIFLIVLVFHFGAVALVAQHQIKATYTHYNNSGPFDITGSYTLYANNQKSSYKFNLPQQKKDIQILDSQDSEYRIIKYNNNRNEFYIEYQKNKIHQLYAMDRKLIVAEDTPKKLEWTISSESKNIGEYTVIKAETSFRGRNYIAWFAPAIPISAGPWKLFGLPGLILEAKDKEKEYSWHLTSLEEIDVSNEIEIKDANYTSLSLKDAMSNYIAEKTKEDRIRSTRVNKVYEETYGVKPKLVEHTKMQRNNNTALERTFEWEED